MITGKEDKSFVADDIQESKNIVVGARQVMFSHEASQGDKEIDLNNLNTPADMASNGFMNPSSAEIASTHLSIFRKNLELVSTRGPLTQFLDYIITDSGNILFLGTLAQTGALEGEIFTGLIKAVDAGGTVVADARSFDVTISCPEDVAVGTTILNIGTEFQVNANPLHQTGNIKPAKNGKRIYRNKDNAVASPTADGNFHEIDSGSGFGTQIELNAPLADGDIIGVDFGLSIASGDMQIFGSLEQLQGSILKLAQDAANDIHGDNDTTRYLAANPSALERRAFGDKVLNLERILEVETEVSSYHAITERYGSNPAGVYNSAPAYIDEDIYDDVPLLQRVGSNPTRYMALKKVRIKAGLSGQVQSTGAYVTGIISKYDISNALITNPNAQDYTAAGWGGVNSILNTVLEVGEYITFGAQANTWNGGPTILAEHFNKQKIKDLI